MAITNDTTDGIDRPAPVDDKDAVIRLLKLTIETINKNIEREAKEINYIFDSKDDRIRKLEIERDHWKSNHDNIVSKFRILSQRPDLPVDRLPAIRKMEDLETKLADALKALNRCAYGFDQIHKSLMSSGPKQASGEVVSFFLEETLRVLKSKT